MKNINRKAIILLLLLPLALPLAAQRTGTITGSTSSSFHTLEVECDIIGAWIEIEPLNVKIDTVSGRAPFTARNLPRGSYRVSVKSPGFAEQSRVVELSSSTSIGFYLQSEELSLMITSNVSGARVQIEGENIGGRINGYTPYSAKLPPGYYLIKVNAPGYFPTEQTINLNHSRTVDFQLRAKSATLRVIIPNDILNYSIANPASQIKIYDNGRRISSLESQLSPGQHTIRVMSGAFAAQRTINIRAGEVYRLELDFGMILYND